MVATVTVDLKKGYAHSVCALLERGPPGIVLWADCDPMMASSCRVAFSWWRANLSYLCRTLGVDEPAAETRISVAICPRTTMVQTSASAAFALAIVAAATGRAVRRDVGVTGELDLMGNLHAVRGVRSKVRRPQQAEGGPFLVEGDRPAAGVTCCRPRPCRQSGPGSSCTRTQARCVCCLCCLRRVAASKSRPCAAAD